MPRNWREYWRFSGVAARQTRGADGYQHLGQPARWSRVCSGHFPWDWDTRLLSVALERVPIEHVTLALVVAAAAVPR